MFLATKHFVAIAAAFFLVLFFGDDARSQSSPRAKILPTPEREAGRPGVSGNCEVEIKAHSARQRFMLTTADFPSHGVTSRAKDDCKPIGAPLAALRSGDPGTQEELPTQRKRREVISTARERTLQILKGENACSAWFREMDADPGNTFESVEIVSDESGPGYVRGMKEIGQPEVYKHPYVARTREWAGRNAIIELNANGAFFKRASAVLEQDRKDGPIRPGGLRTLQVASYSGNSVQAQVTTLLHEFGHIIGRLPEDDDSWNGESVRNTAEVLRHCRPEIHAVGRRKAQATETADKKEFPF
jgi:hypothetical protein